MQDWQKLVCKVTSYPRYVKTCSEAFYRDVSGVISCDVMQLQFVPNHSSFLASKFILSGALLSYSLYAFILRGLYMTPFVVYLILIQNKLQCWLSLYVIIIRRVLDLTIKMSGL
jgi:hypothetical protein